MGHLTDWTDPGTMGNVPANGNPDWHNPDSAKIQNDGYAACDVTPGGVSDALYPYNFNFDLPAGTIDGIEMRMDMYGENGNIMEGFIGLFYDSAPQGDSQARPTTWWESSDSDTYVIYGGVSNKWGATPSVSDVNLSDFGVFIMVSNTHGTQHRMANVDHIQMRIYYSPDPVEEEGYEHKVMGTDVASVLGVEDIKSVLGVE